MRVILCYKCLLKSFGLFKPLKKSSPSAALWKHCIYEKSIGRGLSWNKFVYTVFAILPQYSQFNRKSCPIIHTFAIVLFFSFGNHRQYILQSFCYITIITCLCSSVCCHILYMFVCMYKFRSPPTLFAALICLFNAIDLLCCFHFILYIS